MKKYIKWIVLVVAVVVIYLIFGMATKASKSKESNLEKAIISAQEYTQMMSPGYEYSVSGPNGFEYPDCPIFKDDDNNNVLVKEYWLSDGWFLDTHMYLKSTYSKDLGMYVVTDYRQKGDFTVNHDFEGNYREAPLVHFVEKWVYYLDKDFKVVAVNQHLRDQHVIDAEYEVFKDGSEAFAVYLTFTDSIDVKESKKFIKEYKKERPVWQSY